MDELDVNFSNGRNRLAKSTTMSAEDLYRKYNRVVKNTETDENLKELRLINGSPNTFEMYTAYRNELQVGAHWHDCFEMLFIQSGTVFAMVNDQYYVLQKNDILFVSPGDLHGTTSIPEHDVMVYIIKFTLGIFGNRISEMSESKYLLAFYNKKHNIRNHINESSRYYSEIVDIFKRLIEENDQKQNAYQFYIKSLLYQLICLFIRLKIVYIEEVGADNSESDRISILMRYVEENWKSPPKREEAAKIMFMSEGHFSRYFKKTMGTNYKEYIDNLIITKASELLENSDFSIKQVALEVGFSNTSNFIRLFKNIKGYTPGSIREQQSASVKGGISE